MPKPSRMVFHLCRDDDRPGKCETVVWAVRHGDQIKEIYHDMKIGDCRQLGTNRYIMRVK